MNGLPNDKERVATQVDALDDVLVVLEDELDEGSVIGGEDGGVLVEASAGGSGRDASGAEDAGDLEVVRHLQRGVRRDVGHAVEPVSLLAVHLPRTARQNERPRQVNHAVMIRPLWVRPRSTCRQICPTVPMPQTKWSVTTHCLRFKGISTMSPYLLQ